MTFFGKAYLRIMWDEIITNNRNIFFVYDHQSVKAICASQGCHWGGAHEYDNK